MIKLLTILLSMLISTPVFADVVPTSFVKLRYYADNATYLFDVSQESPRENYILRIACIDKCIKSQYFSEEIGDTPLGVIKLSDESDLLLTTWVAGDGYRIRVYSANAAGIFNKLEQYSKTLPNLTWSDGRPTLMLTQPKEGSGKNFAQIRYTWNGREFIKSH
jgi:hypothetical protein